MSAILKDCYTIFLFKFSVIISFFVFFWLMINKVPKPKAHPIYLEENLSKTFERYSNLRTFTGTDLLSSGLSPCS